MATTLSCSGRAALCFACDSNWFQGIFICALSRKQLGLIGEELPVDDCIMCSDGGYQEYRLTVIQFTSNKEVEVVVKKTGGSLCRLDSNAIQFHPSILLTDDKAVEAIEIYFPSIAERVDHDTECTVCFGDMEITELAFPS